MISAPMDWKIPFLQSITSLPFGTTLLITVKYGTKDEKRLNRTSDSKPRCSWETVYQNNIWIHIPWIKILLQFINKHRVKHLNNWWIQLEMSEKRTLWMSYILNRNPTWQHLLKNVFLIYSTWDESAFHICMLLLRGKLTEIVWRQGHKNQLGDEE